MTRRHARSRTTALLLATLAVAWASAPAATGHGDPRPPSAPSGGSTALVDPDGNRVFVDDHLHAEDEGLLLTPAVTRASALAAAKAPKAKKKLKTLVVPVYWSGAGKDTSNAKIKKRIKATMKETDTYYRTVSRGKIGHTTTALGWQKISRPSTTCGIMGQMEHVASQASARARKAGKNPARYDRVIFYVTQKACGKDYWGVLGLGSMPGRYVWLEGTLAPNVVIHELGHNLGLEHSNYYACGTSTRRLVHSSKPSRCQVLEYQDAADVMGNMPYARWFSGPKLASLGWLSKAQFAGNTSTTKKSYSLWPLASTSKKTKVVRVKASKTRNYWVEYRTRTGLDSKLPTTVTGVQIRMTDSRASLTPRNASVVLDMHPVVESMDNYEYRDIELVSLASGSSWVSPEGIRFDVGSVGKTAKVTVTRKASKAKKPGAPTKLRAVAGYGTLQFAWERPKDNGMPVTHYDVVVTGPEGKSEHRVLSAGGTRREFAVSYVTAGSSYSAKVRAVSPLGPSAWTAVTKGSPLDPSPELTIDSPAPGATLSGPTFQVTVTATARQGHPLAALEVCSYESQEYCQSASPRSGTAHTFTFTLADYYWSGSHEVSAHAMVTTTTNHQAQTNRDFTVVLP